MSETKKYRIGDIVEWRADGSFIYMSHKGIVNVDNQAELHEIFQEDKAFLKNLERN
jgi:uncharacterized protein YijF (DUF1287 family)